MVPSAFQVPPLPVGASQISDGRPPSDETVLSLPPAKKPKARLSADQNGKVAPSVPTNARARRSFNGLTQSKTDPCPPAAEKASSLPFGESTGGPAKSPVKMRWVPSSAAMSERTAFAELESPRKWIVAATAEAISTTAAVAHTHRSRFTRLLPDDAATPACDPLSEIHFSSVARSLALCQRSSGSFARHFLTMRSKLGGVSGCNCEIEGGSVVRIAAIRLARLLALKAGLPVTISCSSSPKAKMSVRASASFPSNCSGAMYWKVPTMVPSPVSLDCSIVISVRAAARGAGPICLAKPKSMSLAPFFVSMTLAGFRSRCVIPNLCALARASAICAA